MVTKIFIVSSATDDAPNQKLTLLHAHALASAQPINTKPSVVITTMASISPNPDVQMSDSERGYALHKAYTRETGEWVPYGTFSGIRNFVRANDSASRGRDSVQTEHKSAPPRTMFTAVPCYVGAMLYALLCFVAGAFRSLLAIVRRLLEFVRFVSETVKQLTSAAIVVFVMWAMLEAMVRASGAEMGKLGIWNVVSSAVIFVGHQVKSQQQVSD